MAEDTCCPALSNPPNRRKVGLDRRALIRKINQICVDASTRPTTNRTRAAEHVNKPAQRLEAMTSPASGVSYTTTPHPTRA